MTRNDVAITLVDAMRASLLKAYRELSYQDYLLTDHWLSVRQAAIKRSDGQCRLCRSRERLEVHHNSYENFGNEQVEDLVVLCHDCHAKFHDKHKPVALHTPGGNASASAQRMEEIDIGDETVTVIRLRVTSVKYQEDYTLELIFEGGRREAFDLANIVQKSGYESLQDLALFTQVDVDHAGCVRWQNGTKLDYDFFLREGKFVAYAFTLASARNGDAPVASFRDSELFHRHRLPDEMVAAAERKNYSGDWPADEPRKNYNP